MAILTGWNWITAAIIIFIWVSLGYINKYLQGYAHAKATKQYITMPMSIYFGWITMAAPLNIAMVIYNMGYPQVMTNPIWAMAWLGIGYITSIIVFYRLRYLSYIAVTVWALI